MEPPNPLPNRDQLIDMIPIMFDGSSMSQAISDIFTKIINHEIDFQDEKIQLWLRNDFGYFLKRIRGLKGHGTNEAQEAQTIFLSFLNLVKTIGLNQLFIGIYTI